MPSFLLFIGLCLCTFTCHYHIFSVPLNLTMPCPIFLFVPLLRESHSTTTNLNCKQTSHSDPLPHSSLIFASTSHFLFASPSDHHIFSEPLNLAISVSLIFCVPLSSSCMQRAQQHFNSHSANSAFTCYAASPNQHQTSITLLPKYTNESVRNALIIEFCSSGLLYRAHSAARRNTADEDCSRSGCLPFCLLVVCTFVYHCLLFSCTSVPGFRSAFALMSNS